MGEISGILDKLPWRRQKALKPELGLKESKSQEEGIDLQKEKEKIEQRGKDSRDEMQEEIKDIIKLVKSLNTTGLESADQDLQQETPHFSCVIGDTELRYVLRFETQVVTISLPDGSKKSLKYHNGSGNAELSETSIEGDKTRVTTTTFSDTSLKPGIIDFKEEMSDPNKSFRTYAQYDITPDGSDNYNLSTRPVVFSANTNLGQSYQRSVRFEGTRQIPIDSSGNLLLSISPDDDKFKVIGTIASHEVETEFPLTIEPKTKIGDFKSNVNAIAEELRLSELREELGSATESSEPIV